MKSEVKPRRELRILIFLITLHCSLITVPVRAAPLDPRSEGAMFFPASVAYPEASNLLEMNPAGLGVGPGWNTSFFYNRPPAEGGGNRFGLLMHSGPLGVSAQRMDRSTADLPGGGTEVSQPEEGGAPETGSSGDLPNSLIKGSIGLGFGANRFHYGLSFHAVDGGTGHGLDRLGLVDLGVLYRAPRVSVGLALYNLGSQNGRGLVPIDRADSNFRLANTKDEYPKQPIEVSPRIGVGVRPFKSLTTVTADWQQMFTGVKGARSSIGVLDLGWDQVLKPGVHLQSGFRTDDGLERKTMLLGFLLKTRHARVGYQAMATAASGPGGSETAITPALAMLHLHGAAHEDSLFEKNAVAEILVPSELPDQRAVSFLFDERDHFLEFAARIRRLAENEEVHTVLLRIRSLNVDLGRLQEIRSLMGALRKKGKTVVAYLEAFALKEYYLATAADRILLYPHGHLELLGLKIEGMFFKGTLDWLGVVPQFVRAGEYKGAPEQFTEKEFSPKHRENLDSMLGDLFDQMVEGIAEGRRLSREKVAALVDRGFLSAQEAVDEGLVDGTSTWEEAQQQVRQGVGSRSRVWDEARVKAEYESGESWAAPETIAVVYVSGVLARGEGGRFPFFTSAATFADSMVAVLRRLEGARSVRAVVLRVNSPGGDVFASDQIWAAVRRLSQKKPVVVSMGSVGASGAYYLSMGARPVLADGATITGSIGVFYGKFVLKGLYEKLGITKQILKRGRHADVESDVTLLTPEQVKEVQKGVDAWYGVFLDKVREGRGLEAGALEGLAGGRVWTGRQARERGLVDREGGLLESLDLAREKAGIPEDADLRVVEWPRPKALRSFLKTLVAAPASLLNLDFEAGPFFFLGPVGLE
ncbi:MAG: signal peptide peptidase SppA [Nitrospirae bacterium]|nr:signal peptide peptidase SppA [Nitrospirota bacterium]